MDGVVAALLLDDWHPVPSEGTEVRFLIRDQQGIVVMAGDGLTADDISKQMDAWHARMKREPLKRLLRLDVLYLMEQPVSAEVDRAIARERRQFGFSSRMLRAGCVDFATPKVRLHLGKTREALQALVSPGRPAPDLQAAVEEAARRGQQSADFLRRLTSLRPVGTWVIFAVCLAMFSWEVAAGGSESLQVLLRLGADYPPLVKQGEWWRVVGSTFLHIGLIHFMVNMWALIDIGSICERLYGHPRYLALYAVSGVVASLVSERFQQGVSAGASGALFGVIGATALLGWRMRDEIPTRLNRRLTGSMVPVIAYNLLFGVGVGQVGGLMINNAAHIGGLLAGLAFAAVVPSAMSPRQPRVMKALAPLLWVIGVAPFLVQGLVVWHAVQARDLAGAPRHEHTDGLRRFRFSVPSAVEVEERDRVVVLSWPGISLGIEVMEATADISMQELLMEAQREPERLLGLPRIESQSVVKRGGRDWALFEGRSKEGLRAWVAVTPSGRKVYNVSAYAMDDSIAEAKRLLDVVLESFKPL